MTTSEGVDVFTDGIEHNPCCPHGPTLLFKRRGPKAKEYYACSAYRNRRECSFYLEASKFQSKISQSNWSQVSLKKVKNIDHTKKYMNYVELLKLGNSKVSFCFTCNELFNSNSKTHDKCNVKQNLTIHQLHHPTEVLIPKEDPKKEAQYFFSKEAVKIIVQNVKKLQLKRVICIGTPRIHEFLLNNKEYQIETLLLDLDESYHNFYSRDHFIWYNMFNNHVFFDTCQPILSKFLKEEKVAVLIDPPFGGRVEPLAYTLDCLSKAYRKVNRTSSEKGNVKFSKKVNKAIITEMR